MLRSLREFEGYTVSGTDGDVGTVVEFLLDDDRWTIRYLVVQLTGPFFLDARRVLVSPIAFLEADEARRRFRVALSMDKVRNSPSVDLDKPVSRQHERDYNRYYGYPHYWGYSGLWAREGYPGMLSSRAVPEESVPPATERTGDVHLRSASVLRGYRIEGTDGAIGHVADFIVDNETWAVHYLVIDTRNWWFGKKVLVAPQWASRVAWPEGQVYVELSRQAIKASPEWNGDAALNREYEAQLCHHYGHSVDDAGSAIPAEHNPGPTHAG